MAVPEKEASGSTLSGIDLKPDALRLLRAVIADPCQPVSFFPTKLQMSKRTILRLRKSLVDQKIIQEQQMQISGRGRPSILLAPTPHALKTLGEES